MKTLTIISNLENKDAKADEEILRDILLPYFDTQVVDLFDNSIFSQNSFYLIRNIWGRVDGKEKIYQIYESLKKRNLPYSNQFNGKGDQKGKYYLTNLFEEGRQVIPTFNNPDNALKLESDRYLLKPIYGSSSEGIITVSRENLAEKFNGDKYLIQPEIKFVSEISFFFVDNIFQYALQTKNSRWDLTRYLPVQEEMALAKEFVEWNPISGIQRIDFIKTKNNSLLLLEIEDWCPYLSLADVENIPKETFAKAIADSIQNQI